MLRKNRNKQKKCFFVRIISYSTVNRFYRGNTERLSLKSALSGFLPRKSKQNDDFMFFK